MTTKTGNPTLSKDWSPAEVVNDVLNQIGAAINCLNYGPYIVVMSSNWEKALAEPYCYSKIHGSVSLRKRLLNISSVKSVLTDNDMKPWEIALYMEVTP